MQLMGALGRLTREDVCKSVLRAVVRQLGYDVWREGIGGERLEEERRWTFTTSCITSRQPLIGYRHLPSLIQLLGLI